MPVFRCFKALSRLRSERCKSSQLFYLVCLRVRPFPILINHAPSISTVPLRLEFGLHPIRTNGCCVRTSCALQRQTARNEGRWGGTGRLLGELPALHGPPRPAGGERAAGRLGAAPPGAVRGAAAGAPRAPPRVPAGTTA